MSDRAERPEDQVAATTTQRWTRSPALVAGSATGLLLAAVGLIAGRIDVALLALPLVAAVALSWDRRPAGDEQATVALSLADAGNSRVAYSLEITSPPQSRDDRPALQRARR